MKKAVEQIYSILKADATLASLLGATTSDSKIYPEIPDQFEDFPCIIYSVNSEAYNSVPRNTTELTIVFQIMAKTSATAVQNIYEALNDVLNYQISTTQIVYSIQEDAFDNNSENRLLFSKVVRFRITTRDVS